MGAARLEPGTLIGGKYRIDRVLGEGGMGIVYAATHTQLGQRVALKFLLPAAAKIPEVAERFSREARAAVQIHSEHVARVLDVGEQEPGVPYIVIEYLEGQSLDALLQKETRLAATRAVDYILQASEALAEAHALGIVHRDIKPGNLFLAQRPGRSLVKVLDFGISKMPLSTENRDITAASALLGSPGYMSPEQIAGARDADVRSDIWALGVVLYEMLTGKPPFPADTLAALVAAVLYQPHAAVRSIVPELPAELGAIVDRCLAKEADRRFPNIAELARALTPFGSPGSTGAFARIAEVLGVDAALAPVGLAPATPLGPPAAAAAPAAIHGAPTMAPRDQEASAAAAAAPPRAMRDTTLAPNTMQPRPRTGLRTTAIVIGILGALAVAAMLVVFVTMRMRHAPSANAAPLVATTAPAPSSSVASMTSATTEAPPSSTAPIALADPPPSATTSAAHAPSAHAPHAPKPRASAAPSAAPVATGCHTEVASIDPDGSKHFKQVCP